jgi:hypothetical protein
MSQILYPPARAQTLGEVLKTGTQIFRLSFTAAVPYAIVVAICSNLATLRNLAADLPLPSIDTADAAWWGWNVAGSILALLFGSAMILRQKALAAAERASFTAEMRQSGALLSSLIVNVALSIFAVSVALLPVAYVLPLTGLSPRMTTLAGVNPGMLLLLIPLSLPAAWISLGLLFAPPALVVRKLGPIEAMIVSFRLLRGNWWRASVLSGALVAALLLMLIVVAAMAEAATLMSGTTDIQKAAVLAMPLALVASALVVPWCGAQVLAMMGDLMVRQDDARRAGTGSSNGAGTGPAA